MLMFKDVISLIKPLDSEAMDKCQLRLDNLTKPINSLHAFEHLARQIAGITGNHRPKALKKSIVLLAGKHSTPKMISNFRAGGSAINIFAEHVSAHVVLVDMRAATDVIQAIKVGIKIARQEIEKGSQILGIGELGINTISNASLDICISQNENDLLDVLSKIGGLEIAGLVGVILGAASGGAAVVLDGLSTSLAALIAVRIAPGVKDYLIASHFSVEPEHKDVLDIIGIPAYLHLDMSLGEGTGAALGISLVNASLHVLNDMKTFGEAEVAVAEDGPGALIQNKDVMG